MAEIKSRSNYWDNIKGLLMLLTVFAHVLFKLQYKSGLIDSIVDYIYMFHMPAFVFVSGYFGKSERSRSFESIAKLIFLFFIFNNAMGFIYGFNSLLKPVYSYWYLIALIIWRLTAHHIAKFKEANFILIAVALFAGFFPAIDNTFAIARTICFYPFYMAGYMLSEEKSNSLISTQYSKRLLTGIILIIVGCIFAFGGYRLLNYTDESLQMGAYSSPVDAFARIIVFIVAFIAIYALRHIIPDKKIPLLTTFGRNTLAIYILHRPFTIIVSDLIRTNPDAVIILIAFVSSIVICLAFGNDFVAKYFNKFASLGSELFKPSENKKFNIAKLALLVIAACFVFTAIAPLYANINANDINKVIGGESNNNSSENNASKDKIYPVMNKSQETAFNNAFRITFSGDLILLEDQVKRAYNGNGYDFSDVFEYAQKYISSADLAIGVFEGPMAGEKAEYTSGNFDDGKSLYLNFPDEFAQEVKSAGFDLVTTANNHLLDKGMDGAKRTLDILDSIGLDHTGSYRNLEEKQKEHIKFVEYQGIKIAVLSYTYGSNYTDINELADGNLSYITSIISGTSGDLFEKLKLSVEQDFKDAKALNPDLIVVLPHVGTQFSNAPDETQKVWFEIFKSNGADIILGDHPHVVEPATIEKYNGKNVFTAYCPGNFANIYRENQGDTSMLVDVYIDRESKNVIGGSIVPLYTQARIDGNFRALPIYEIMNDDTLKAQLSTDDFNRAKQANATITNVVFGSEMDITSISERYYFNELGFIRVKTTGLEFTDEMKDSVLWKAIEATNSVCFVGDSVTEGTKNGGCPWYEPIEEYIVNKEVTNYSKGGCTVSYMIDHINDIPVANLYVIALGTNDIRYRNESTCAMTSSQYVSKIDTLRKLLSEKSANAKFVFIAPWYSTDGDPYSKLSFKDKTSMTESYSSALANYCSNNNYGFINANDYIKSMLTYNPDRKFLLDHIHPNASEGVIMYSQAVLLQK